MEHFYRMAADQVLEDLCKVIEVSVRVWREYIEKARNYGRERELVSGSTIIQFIVALLIASKWVSWIAK
jgi:hypothetical protein